MFTNECVQPFSDSPLRTAAVITHSGAGNDGAAQHSEQGSSIEHARRRKRFSSLSEDFSPLVAALFVVLHVCSRKRRRTPLFTSTPMHAQADDSYARANLEQGERRVPTLAQCARVCAVMAQRSNSDSERPTTSSKFDESSTSDRSNDDDDKQRADTKADE